jgi:LPXTG-motif cell wall-anchored protein
MLLGCVLIYSTMFTTGYFIYGETTKAFALLGLCALSGGLLIMVWKRIKGKVL